MTTPRYFAEYLPRLKTISICIEYSADDVKSLRTDGKGNLVNLVPKSSTGFSFRLPVQSVPNFDISTRGSMSGSQSLVFKLPSSASSETEGNERARDIDTLTNRDDFQWSAKELKKLQKEDDNTLICKNCQCVLIRLNLVRRIDPMPSEYWSEMMEFWHCHRPSAEGPNSYESINDRFNNFRPGKNNLIVGSYYLVLNPPEFNMVEEDQDCLCQGCGAKLGTRDVSTQNYRVYMWNILLKDTTAATISFSPYLQAYSLLVDSISSTAVRYYVLSPKSDSGKRIVVWCLSIGLEVTLSGTDQVLGNCLKLLYRDSPEEIAQFLTNAEEGHSFQYDLIELDDTPFADFHHYINKTHHQLPSENSSFKGWKVSYLPERLRK